jgi:hypothetical protein
MEKKAKLFLRKVRVQRLAVQGEWEGEAPSTFFDCPLIPVGVTAIPIFC